MADHQTVVRGVDHQRVVELATGLEQVEEACQLGVLVAHRRVVLGEGFAEVFGRYRGSAGRGKIRGFTIGNIARRCTAVLLDPTLRVSGEWSVGVGGCKEQEERLSRVTGDDELPRSTSQVFELEAVHADR